MQKPVPLGQTGSVLAGCLILCLVLTSAAAGLLTITSAWNSSVSASLDRERLADAAETGISLGARWLRAVLTPANLAGYPSTPISVDGLVRDGATLDVDLEYDAGAGTHDLVSIATFDGCHRYEIRWRINAVAPPIFNDGQADLHSITFMDWRETDLPCGG